MKTLMLRVCYLGVAVTTILASPGTEEPANADTTDPVADVLAPLQIADADALAEAELPVPLAPVGDTNAAPQPVIPVQEPTPPPNVKLSPALAEVVKLVQAGVSPDVLMAYVTNSTAVFNVDSDTIVYLNDLGVTNTVITALIQHDASPDTAARKAAATAAQPLPPGVAATAPVTNVYPPAAIRTFPAAGQTSYPGDFTAVTDTNAEPAEVQPPVVTAPLASENVTVNHFYSSLAPYGSWVDVDGYGLCWRPTVAAHDPYWRPYGDRGRWLWSDSGWYWYSDYSWGWAPFHYGRWCSYPRLGWIWVPGTVWAPSWVTWRYTDSYCGWAPLPPGCGYRSGIGLTWYGRGVSIGFDFGLSSHCWSYVPTSRFCDWNVRRHCLPENRLHVVHKTAIHANRISVRNKSIVNDGIEPNTIARASRTKVPTMKIKDGVLPANNGLKPERLENRGNELAVVRPKLPKAAPATVVPVASRGSATRAKPVTIGNSGQAPKAAARPAPNTLAPREVARNNAPAAAVVREQGNAQRHESVTVRPQNRPAPQPQNSTPNLQRQTPAPAQQRQTLAPAQQRSTPHPMAPRNNVAAKPAPAPATRNPAPPSRNFAPAQNQPAARSAPQAAPAPRNISPMIRSYAQPQQRSTPHPMAPRVAPPSVRATPAPAARPQFSAPQVSRPSVSTPPRSAPSVGRSAPSGGGGGGGGRSGGGNGGGGGRGGRGN